MQTLPMLNRTARYRPIVGLLRRHRVRGGAVLEIGSGAFGIGEYYDAPFVGCDLHFDQRPRAPLRPVVGSGLRLPFRDATFDAVVVSDVLEHVPASERRAVVREALRVTSTIAVFGFPAGEAALVIDRNLAALHHARGLAPPTWLLEHLEMGFPREDILDDLPSGWRCERFGNESLQWHEWIVRREMRRMWRIAFGIVLTVAPGVVQWLLRWTDRPPCYRQLCVVVRDL